MIEPIKDDGVCQCAVLGICPELMQLRKNEDKRKEENIVEYKGRIYYKKCLDYKIKCQQRNEFTKYSIEVLG